MSPKWGEYDQAKANADIATHAAIAAAHHTRYTDTEALAAAWANINTKSLINLLDNGSFEVGDPPTGWTQIGGGGTRARSTEQVKIGTYSVKIVSPAIHAGMRQDVSDFSRYKGRKVTGGMWIYASEASVAFFNLDDGVSQPSSAYHSGVAGWEWITLTLNVNASATVLGFIPYVAPGSKTAYFDGAILVEGDSCPAFSPKPDETLINHHTAAYTISAYETGHALHTNLGAGGAIQIELPQTVAAGFTCRFAVMAAFELRIHPGAAGAIYINGAKQTDDKYITADDEAESVILTADGNGDWIASCVVGTWGVEAP